jgi:hypothetical protein
MDPFKLHAFDTVKVRTFQHCSRIAGNDLQRFQLRGRTIDLQRDLLL